MSDTAFDFVRYFTRVQSTPFWHQMQLGMATFAQVQPGMTVLDLGCGPGRLVAHLEQIGVKAIGADADERMLAKAQTLYPTIPLIATPAETVPFADDQFDVVLAGNLLFFLPNPIATLREMRRIVKPRGWVTVWNPSENMSQSAAAAYAATQPEMDSFAQKHIVNWAGVAESNRRWSATDLAHLFAQANLVDFATQTTLGGLARYAHGRKTA